MVRSFRGHCCIENRLNVFKSLAFTRVEETMLVKHICLLCWWKATPVLTLHCCLLRFVLWWWGSLSTCPSTVVAVFPLLAASYTDATTSRGNIKVFPSPSSGSYLFHTLYLCLSHVTDLPDCFTDVGPAAPSPLNFNEQKTENSRQDLLTRSSSKLMRPSSSSLSSSSGASLIRALSSVLAVRDFRRLKMRCRGDFPLPSGDTSCCSRLSLCFLAKLTNTWMEKEILYFIFYLRYSFLKSWMKLSHSHYPE